MPKREQALGLAGAKNVRHEAPENRHHEQVEYAQPDIESTLYPRGSRIAVKCINKKQQVAHEKQVNAGYEPAAREL